MFLPRKVDVNEKNRNSLKRPKHYILPSDKTITKFTSKLFEQMGGQNISNSYDPRFMREFTQFFKLVVKIKTKHLNRLEGTLDYENEKTKTN